MARLFTDGAEMGDTLFWDNNNNNAVSADNIVVPVGGEWSYKGAWLGATKFIGSDLAEFYLRYRIYSNLVGAATSADILSWGNSVSGALYGGFTVDGYGRFAVKVSNTIVDHCDLVMQNSTWYLIELHVVLDDVNGRIEAYIDGTPWIDYNGDTKPGAGAATVDYLLFNTSVATAVYIDDLALNDTTGLTDNSWCGDGIIVKMVPNGNGSHNNWHGSDGNDIDNYLLVDEYPNDGDLTYVYHNGADSGTQDQYTLTDLDYTNKTVLRIYPEARARKSSATGYTLKLGILPSGGADDVSAGRTLLVDYYSRVIGKEYTTNPVTAVAWVEADLDSLQFIAEVG